MGIGASLRKEVGNDDEPAGSAFRLPGGGGTSSRVWLAEQTEDQRADQSRAACVEREESPGALTAGKKRCMIALAGGDRQPTENDGVNS